jgi:hypothetical protein
VRWSSREDVVNWHKPTSLRVARVVAGKFYGAMENVSTEMEDAGSAIGDSPI